MTSSLPPGSPGDPHQTATPMSVALVVEDDRALADFTQACLEQMGISGWLVSNLKTALAAASRSRFDFVLLDLNLPDSLGMETLKRFLAAVPDARVVVVSGTCLDGSIREALTLGALAFICKGVNLRDQLAGAVNLIIKRIAANGRRERFVAHAEEVKQELRSQEKRSV